MADPIDNTPIIFSDVAARVRGTLFNQPRELGGNVLSAIEKTLNVHEGNNSASIVDDWYMGAAQANYNSLEAAAAYLGAYGARSILKYQEAVFALLLLKKDLPKRITILDYGAGPCPGYAALIDLWSLISEFTKETLELRYIAVDRAPFMLEVGETFCSYVRDSAAATLITSFEVIRTDNMRELEADMLIVANVLNEGEGNLNCATALTDMLQHINGVKDIIIIEPASKQPSEQLCSLAQYFPGLQHIGPCPSNGAECTEWTFREFAKRTYGFERRCASRHSAARTCKYSLALLSYNTEPRRVAAKEYVIVRPPTANSLVMTCKHGEKQMFRTSRGIPWDLIDISRNMVKSYP
ncbi:MAG: hypothetical protein ACJ74W_13215 [Pyrinomonadaceae bacterium]